MKISSAIGLAPPANLARPMAESTAGSFASMIASGRSVDSIRSERAFGFSETGLFGAARILKQVGGKAPALKTGNARADAGAKSSRTEPALGNRPKSDVSTLSGKAMEPHARLLSVSIDRPKAAETLAYLAPHRSGSLTNARAARFTKYPLDCRHFTINTARLFEQRKRPVIVSGLDDALSITIGPVVTDSLEQHSLISAFFSTVMQYGMTLGLMQLNHNERISFDHFGIWRV